MTTKTEEIKRPPVPLYAVLARLIGAYHRCTSDKANESQTDWAPKHRERVESLTAMHMPRGSGFDNGTTLCFDRSSGERLVFETSFHHMDSNGMYDGWTEHEVIITPSLQFGFSMRVTGRDRDEIKSYIAECFDDLLRTLIDEFEPRP